MAINDAGQITGFGDIFHATHGFVLSPMQTITGLKNLVQSFNLPSGTANSLLAKLSAAQAAGSGSAASCSDLTDFITQVQSLSGKKMTRTQANQLITGANQIKSAQGCP